jgi:hypothetical protein
LLGIDKGAILYDVTGDIPEVAQCGCRNSFKASYLSFEGVLIAASLLENVLSCNGVRAWNGKVRAVSCGVATALAKILPNELAL